MLWEAGDIYLLKINVGMPNDPATPTSITQENYIRKGIYRMCIILVLITTKTLKLLKYPLMIK